VFNRLGHFVAHRAKLSLAMSALFIVLSGALGAMVIPAMSSGGYDDPNADSSIAYNYLKDTFKAEEPWSILVIDAPVSADDPATIAAVAKITAEIQKNADVTKVASYWSLGNPAQLKSTDGKAAYLFVYLKGDDLERWNKAAAEIESAVNDLGDLGVTTYFAGPGAVMNGINGSVTKDIAFAESIAIPLSVILTILVFGSFIASLTPFIVALFAIPGGLFVLWVVHFFTDVSVFGLNILTGLGLGLGIDYALLIVNRFREELDAGDTTEDAVVRTVETAGRTVVFSGLTVALTLGSLSLFPLYFLQTFAWSGVAVVLLAVVGAIVPLPALLALLGHRVDRGKVLAVLAKPAGDHGMWNRIARTVMRAPWTVAMLTIAVLGVLFTPALGIKTGQPDERVLPATNKVAVAGQVIRDRFEGRESSPIEIIVPGGKSADIVSYAKALSQVEHVVRVVTSDSVVVDGNVVAPNPQGAGFVAGNDVRLQAIIDVDSRSADGEAVTVALRAISPPTDGTVIGGAAAQYTDSQNGVLDNVPHAMLWIAIATLLLLFLFTGSVLLPIKAVILNVLSLGATFGVLKLVFQDGHLNGLLGGFTVRGVLDTSQLVLIVVIVFGLSMDYELFLLSRIKELHDAGEDTERAVALGLQRSGRIITAAAWILAVVFAAFITSGVSSMKLMGFGIAFAILLDASIVRALLVPALMRIAGRWNWWAPAPLARLHARLGLAHD
jgi:RND superfamily putative drug exporter